MKALLRNEDGRAQTKTWVHGIVYVIPVRVERETEGDHDCIVTDQDQAEETHGFPWWSHSICFMRPLLQCLRGAPDRGSRWWNKMHCKIRHINCKISTKEDILHVIWPPTCSNHFKSMFPESGTLGEFHSVIPYRKLE